MTHRKDIDGLRAVAVLSVLAFHVGADAATGGFVGVDVFFVISGYLIGSIILRSVERGQFSYLEFYERRIRRIVPALLVMIAAVVAAGYCVLFPAEYEDTSRSALAALASVANFYFWATTDYFGVGDQQPLIHTWSLAVEEQFYLLLPPLLAVCSRYLPGRVRTVVLVVALLSFAANLATCLSAPMAAFYSPVTRTWELMLGVLLATGVSLPVRRWVREVAALAGLLLIVAAVLLVSKRTPFPGFAALAPTLGAALIIAAGEQGPTWVGRGLCLRPLVIIGLMSYSLYLWHVPVLFFLHTASTSYPGLPASVVDLIGIAFSFGLAGLSWRFVERPFRQGGGMARQPRQVFAQAGLACVLLTAVLASTLHLDGVPGRFSAEAVRISGHLDDRLHDEVVDTKVLDRCFLTSSNPGVEFDPGHCLKRREGHRNYLLLGDSHAAMLWSGLSTQLPEAHVMLAAASGCRPTLEHAEEALERCTALMEQVYDGYLRQSRIDGVIISARWQAADLPRVESALKAMRAQGHRVVLVGPVAEYRKSLPRLLALSVEHGDAGLAERHLKRDLWHLDARVEELAQRAGADYISLIDLVCAQQCVKFTDERIPLQFDYGHFTAAGSMHVANLMRPILLRWGA